MEQIRYLAEAERGLTRPLYEECFPEDSDSFVDYYYREKTRDNRILVMEGPGSAGAEAGAGIQVMLHLNPFLFRFGRAEQQLNYIVAVATAPKARKQGRMFRVMEKALQDMAAQGQPFTFLIPANPRVYASSGFAFVPEQAGACPEVESEETGSVSGHACACPASGSEETGSAWEQDCACLAAVQEESVSGGHGYLVRPAAEADMQELAERSNEWLSGMYDVFPLRSPEYMKRLWQELKAQDGAVLVVTDAAGEPAGIAAYGREAEKGELQQMLARPGQERSAERAVREYLAREGMTQVRNARMPFMVRLLNLSRMMELMGAVCRKDFCLRVQLEDQILLENNGCFELYCQKGSGGLRPIPEGEAQQRMDAAGLVRELFGRLWLYIREWV